jgi:hypothetical protein
VESSVVIGCLGSLGTVRFLAHGPLVPAAPGPMHGLPSGGRYAIIGAMITRKGGIRPGR